MNNCEKNCFPFDLPFELCEIIFGYLNLPSIISCLLVNKAFNRFIVADKKLCKKLKLTINDDIHLEDVFKSERHYQNIKLLNLNQEKMSKVLNFFNDSIMQLEIEDCRMNGKCDVINLNIPKLMKLVISNNSTSVIKLFTNSECCKNLKTLCLFQIHPVGPLDNAIISFLDINESLQEINFHLDDSSNIFKKDISKVLKMKLISVFISYKSNFELQTTTLTNIENFLKTQGDTLQQISLINSANLTLLLRIWNSLKVVKRLYFFSGDSFFDYDTSNLDTVLDANNTLKELEMHALGPVTLELRDLAPFVLAAKNLKSLGVWTLTKNLIEFIAYNHFNLRSISCATFEKDCELFYNDLKSKNGLNDKLHLRQYL